MVRRLAQKASSNTHKDHTEFEKQFSILLLIV